MLQKPEIIKDNQLEQKPEIIKDNQLEVFERVYHDEGWSSHQCESVSGTGSILKHTEELRSSLPEICKKYNINNILDVACGDFNWMKEIVHKFKFYRGADIVNDLIDSNKENYDKLENVEFITADIIEQFDLCIKGKSFDAIILKDVLVHFPDEYVNKVLSSVKTSGIKYVFITHFTDLNKNYDIPEFNGWRPQNFNLDPWNMGEPLEIIPSLKEEYSFDEKTMIDKTLSLWQIK